MTFMQEIFKWYRAHKLVQVLSVAIPSATAADIAHELLKPHVEIVEKNIAK